MQFRIGKSVKCWNRTQGGIRQGRIGKLILMGSFDFGQGVRQLQTWWSRSSRDDMDGWTWLQLMCCTPWIVGSWILRYMAELRGTSGNSEYSRPESDREDLESERGQDLVANLVRNSVANLVNIWTGSTLHWRLTFITTGDYAGSQAQQGDE